MKRGFVKERQSCGSRGHSDIKGDVVREEVWPAGDQSTVGQTILTPQTAAGPEAALYSYTSWDQYCLFWFTLKVSHSDGN